MLMKVVTVSNVLTSTECDIICDYCSPKCQESTVEHGTDAIKNKQIRNSLNTFISFDTNNVKLSNIIQKVGDCLVQVSLDVFDFPINYIEPVQYSEYTEGMYYNEHCDCAEFLEYDRDISASVFLSPRKKYEGGNLSFHNFTVDEKQGSMSIFPSMMSHKVDIVKSGKRSSLVLWGRRPSMKKL